ncbi:MAG: CapA family protein [Cyanobacteria bacterium J06638_20]
MVNVATSTSAQTSTKALAAAGQFRAIALWLNTPLIPQGIYVQVMPDKRPGCLRLVVEVERPPAAERLARYLCHLVWQLNSPLIEGIHLLARQVGESSTLWERRVRIMTPALKAQLAQKRSSQTTISPTIHQARKARQPHLLQEQVKTLRALMLTGSAVAAFVFGCFADVLLSRPSEPTLPLQQRQTSQTETESEQPWTQISSPDPDAGTVWAHHRPTTSSTAEWEATSASYVIGARRDRPNVVNGALEPVGVIQHGRLSNPAHDTVTLVFGGDVTLDDLPYSSYETDEELLAGVAVYQQADVAMVNLDSPLATAATSLEEEMLNRHRPEAIELLKAGGVDIVNLTSDEVLAFGEQGLTETLETLDRTGIYRVGAGRSEREARRPEVLDVKGQRIAYLSYDRAGDRPAYDAVGGTNTPTQQEIIDDIQAIRDEVDWLVVNYRWTEAIPEKPAEFQTNLARMAIDQGADLVIGHHPTQLQGAEIYKGRPIAYSLGDFVFGKAPQAATTESAVLQVALRDRQMKVDLIPVQVTDGQPQQVSQTEADTILAKVQTASQDFTTPMPTSIVLDVRPTPLSEPTSAEADQPFLDTNEPSVEPIPAVEAEPLPETTGETTDPFHTLPEGPQLNVPLDAEDELDIEIEPIPDELLENWGPKTGSQSLSDSESTVPYNLQPHLNPMPQSITPPPAAGMSPTIIPPQPADELEMPSPTVSEEAAVPSEAQSESAPAEHTISPHSEPLVGPLGARPTDGIDRDQAVPAANPMSKFAAPKLALQQQLGMPQTQVFKPLSQLKPHLNEFSVIDVQKQVALSRGCHHLEPESSC